MVRSTDRILEEEVFFCLNLFSGATDGRVLEEEVFFWHLFSGATD